MNWFPFRYIGMYISKNTQECGVYAIINLTNNKFYVGSSKNVYHRLHRHKSDMIKGKHHNPHLKNSVNKYGIDSFYCTLLESSSEENRFTIEQKWITLLNPEYNVTKEVLVNRISKESVELMRNTLLKRYANGEIKAYRQDHTWVRVYQYDLSNIFIKEYPNIADAARENNIKINNLQACVSLPNRKIAGGFIWSKTKLYEH